MIDSRPVLVSHASPHLLDTRLFEHFNLGVAVVDETLLVREWNAVLHEYWGSPDCALGRPFADVMKLFTTPEGDLQSVLRAIRQALSGLTVHVRNHKLKVFPEPPQRLFHIVATPVQSGPDAGRRAAVLFMDSSDAREVSSYYERIIHHAPDGIMVLDPQRRVRIFNQVCGQLIGRNPLEVVQGGAICGDVISCHDLAGQSLKEHGLCPAQELFDGTANTPQTEEMLCTNSDGEERWVETTYSPVKNEEGKVEFVIGVMRDVQQRKLLEENMHQTEKLASLGQLTAGIAHEIKNPLGIILASCEILTDDTRPRDMQQEAARFIKDEVQRLDARLRSFLAFARPQPLHPETFVLNGLIRRAMTTFMAARPKVQVRLDLEVPEVIVRFDQDQLHQVLTNLVLNASDAMEDEGTILVKTHTKGEFVCMEVHDSGPGVPEALRKAIFDPFFTTKPHGTGLGLSILYRIVTAHRGDVKIKQSPVLGGAQFCILLPLAGTITAGTQRSSGAAIPVAALRTADPDPSGAG